MTSNIIGKGSFGCVYRPSLKCNKSSKKTPSIDYTDKISKLMSKKYAKAEMKEYDVIADIDKKNEYYLGKPEMCQPDKSEKVNIDNCKLNISSPSLLIMKDGGMSVSDYVSYLNKRTVSSHEIDFDTFLLAMHNSLMAVKAMHNGGMVHHDLKPQNMVYNPNTEEVKIIDFGISRDRTKLIRDAKASVSGAVTHWSYPWEYMYTNFVSFPYLPLAGKTPQEKKKQFDVIVQEINDKNNTKREASAFRTFLVQTGISDDPVLKKEHLEHWYNFRNNPGPGLMYPRFLEKCIDTFDLYGIGLAFMAIHKYCSKYMDTQMKKKFLDFSLKLVHPNLNLRHTIDSAIAEYETVVLTDLLDKRKMEFVNNKLQPKKMTVHIPSIRSNLTLSKHDITHMDIQNVLNDKCGPGKELNPKTGRCIKKCEPGQIRNDP